MKPCIKSVHRAITILELLGKNEGLSVTEVSTQLNYPKSSVHEILATMQNDGIVEKDREHNRYNLGLKLFELGNQARAGLELRRIAMPFLKRLNEAFNETVYLTVLDRGEVLYIESFGSTKRLQANSIIGVRAPLYCTGVGKAILAFLPLDEIERIIAANGLPKYTENTITDIELLKKDLSSVRRRGYSIDNREIEVGLRCVGAPIYNHEGLVFAAISISGPSQRITAEAVPEIAGLVVQTAAGISRMLGYHGS